MQLVFNEISLNGIPQDQKQGEEFLEKFILAHNGAVNKGFKREIVTSIDFNEIEIAENYYVSMWRNNCRDRDVLRRFKNICEREQIINISDDELEITYQKNTAKGLLYAYINNECSISLMTEEIWKEFELIADLYELTNNKDSKVVIINLSDCSQLVTYKDKLNTLNINTIKEYRNGEEFEKDLDKLFPALIFGKVARNQLKNDIQFQHIPILGGKLLELNNYFVDWNGCSIKNDDFQSKVTKESKETLDMFKVPHTFEVNGKNILVSFHMRYTGNVPGRIYFEPDIDLHKGIVCSLTTKLPTFKCRKSKIR